jgi:hypothetical protein
MKKNKIDGNKDATPGTGENFQPGIPEENRAIHRILEKISEKWRIEMEGDTGDTAKTVILPPGGLKAPRLYEKERVPPDELPDTVILTPPDAGGGASPPSRKADVKDTTDEKQKVSPEDVLTETVILTPSGLKARASGHSEDMQSEMQRSSDNTETIRKPEQEAKEKKPVEKTDEGDFSVETVIIKPGKLRENEEDGFKD